jgi:hypothetical protein
VPPPGTRPEQDPQFRKMKSTIKGDAKALRTHPAAPGEAAKAQAAAVPPGNDVSSQAQAAQVEAMGTAQPGTFDKAKFIAAVRAAIAKAAPANAKEAEEFGSSGKADEVKGAVKGQVGAGKDASAQDIKGKAEQAPDPSKATPKAVTPLAPEKPPGQPGDPGSAAAMPKPAPAEQTDLSQPKGEVDGAMAKDGVTEETLAQSGEPEFTGALAAKKEGEAHSATAPGQVRADESKVLADVKAGAGTDAKGALATMVGAKTSANTGVGGQKSATKAADEKDRARVANEMEAIYTATKTDTEKILTDLDGKVDSAFEAGEKEAKDAFEDYHSTRVRDWKIDRYLLSVGGSLKWIADQFKPLHPDLVKIFADARALYVSKMDVVIGKVADLVGTELGRARARIVEGRAAIKKYVAEQKGDAARLAKEAEASIDSKFDDLDKSVDDKQEGLVDTLANKYVEARNAIDERIKALQDENKGFWEKAKDAIAGVLDTIKKLKDMLLGLLARAANAVETIIKDPIGFLGKLMAGIKAGLDKFVGNIVGHLKKGLQGWLFGQLADAGIELPEKFDLKGIFTLVASIIGLSWANFRTRLVKAVGAPVAGKIEQGLDFVKAIASGGIAAAWTFIADKLSNIKDMVMDQIRNFVIEKIVVAGIQWLIGLLNPAAAFIKACKMIYDVVMWFVNNGARIKALVEAVLDSVEAVLSGGVGKVASMIEDALAKMLPVAIGFLASLLGLGGLSDKIKKILDTVQKPVNMAFDFLIGKAVKFGKSLLTKLKNTKLAKAAVKAKDKAKELYGKGKAYAAAKFEAVKAAAKAKVAGALGKGKDKDAKPGAAEDPNKTHAVKQEALTALSGRLQGVQHFTQVHTIVQGVLNELRPKGLKSLTASLDKEATSVKVEARASEPEERSVPFSQVFPGASKELTELRTILSGRGSHPETGRSGYVAATVSLDGSLVGQAEYNGPLEPDEANPAHNHAEQRLVRSGRLTAAVEQAKQKVAGGGNAEVVFSVSTAPCQVCSSFLAGELGAVKSGLSAAERQHISFRLLATRVYETGHTKTEEAWDKHMERSTKFSDMVALHEAGWDLAQLDVGGKQTTAMRIWAEACARVAGKFSQEGHAA